MSSKAIIVLLALCALFHLTSAFAIISPVSNTISGVVVFVANCTANDIGTGKHQIEWLEWWVNTTTLGYQSSAPFHCNLTFDTRQYPDVIIQVGLVMDPAPPAFQELITSRYFNIKNSYCTAATTCNGHGTCTPESTCKCATGFIGTQCTQCDAKNGYVNYPHCTYGPLTDNSYYAITSPLPNQVISGNFFPLSLSSNNTGLNAVRFYINGDNFYSTQFPYWGVATYNIDTTTYPNGPVSIAFAGIFYYGDGTTATVFLNETVTIFNPCPGTSSCSSNGQCAQDNVTCVCNVGFIGLACDSCAVNFHDYPQCIPGPKPCGDGICNALIGENCTSCVQDCGVCVFNCGDGECNPFAGETCSNCVADCGTCPVVMMLPANGAHLQNTLTPIAIQSYVGAISAVTIYIDGEYEDTSDEFYANQFTYFAGVSGPGNHTITCYVDIEYETEYEVSASFITSDSGSFVLLSPTVNIFSQSVHLSLDLASGSSPISSVQIYSMTNVNPYFTKGIHNGPPFTADIDISSVQYGGMYFSVVGEDADGVTHMFSLSGTGCTASSTCSGHGACSSIEGCVCNKGFASTPCTDNCQYGYIQSSFCDQCDEDYYHYPTCKYCDAAVSCSGHGYCNSTGGCVCDAGFKGPNCTSSCTAATTCNGHGTCSSDGWCICGPGYSGPSCSTCGNSVCDINENCSSCPPDCGSCPMVLLSRTDASSNMVITASSSSGGSIHLASYSTATGPTDLQAWVYNSSTGYIYLRHHPDMIIGTGQVAQNLASSVTHIDWDTKTALLNKTKSSKGVNQWNLVTQAGLWFSIENKQLEGTVLIAPYNNTVDVWAGRQVQNAWKQQFEWVRFVCKTC